MPAVKFNGQAIEVAKLINLMKEEPVATKYLNAAIESNPASSIAVALREQDGNYQFSTGADGMLAVKFNGQAIEVDTLIKHMAAEITLSKLNTPGYFETECGENFKTRSVIHTRPLRNYSTG